MMKRIAIYSYNIRALFSNNPERATGGAEYQLKTLAFSLRERHYDVTFLVGDVQENDIETAQDFKFVKCFSAKNTSTIAKIVYLFKAFNVVRADVFMERGSSTVTFWLSLFAVIFRKKFIFCGASDINFATDEIDPTFLSRNSQRMFHIGIKVAGNIVAQKESQRSLVRKNFKRDAIVIKNFPPIIEVEEKNVKVWDVIWVNNIIPYKKPELVLILARKLPLLKFLMVGGSRDFVYYKEIKKKH